METKKCTKCGVEKEYTLKFFYPVKTVKSGLSSWCRICQCKIRRESRAKNTEAQRQTNSRYYYKNRDKLLKKQREYKAKNKDKIKAYSKKYYPIAKTKAQSIEGRRINNKRQKEYRERDYVKLKTKAYSKRRNEELGDVVIVRAIVDKSNLKREDVTSEMIETKRLIILIKRELKKQSK